MTLDYARRALRRASIKVMHSQAYDIFDKVNQYMVWREEFSLAEAQGQRDRRLFRDQPHRSPAGEDRRAAGAGRRPEDHQRRTASGRRSGLPHRQPAAARAPGRLQAVRAASPLPPPAGSPGVTIRANRTVRCSGAGRPRNYVLSVRDENSDLACTRHGADAAAVAREGRRRSRAGRPGAARQRSARCETGSKRPRVSARRRARAAAWLCRAAV